MPSRLARARVAQASFRDRVMTSDKPSRRLSRVTSRTVMSESNDPQDRWDWSSTMLVVLVIIVVLILTFEIWAPHFGANH